MNLIKINDIRATMGMLLLKETFDGFFLEEAEALTYAKLKVSGRRNKKWYIEEEDGADLTELLRWKEVKGIFFEYIKGAKSPEVFRVSLKADDAAAKSILGDVGYYEAFRASPLQLHLQLRYEKDVLCIITGIYNSEFALDRTMENAWDDAVKKWIAGSGISYEEWGE